MRVGHHHIKTYRDEINKARRCLLKRKIWITPGVDEGKPIALRKALTLMTDEWIDNGNVCHQTIIDMRNALKSVIRNLKS